MKLTPIQGRAVENNIREAMKHLDYARWWMEKSYIDHGPLVSCLKVATTALQTALRKVQPKGKS